MAPKKTEKALRGLFKTLLNPLSLMGRKKNPCICKMLLYRIIKTLLLHGANLTYHAKIHNINKRKKSVKNLLEIKIYELFVLSVLGKTGQKPVPLVIIRVSADLVYCPPPPPRQAVRGTCTVSLQPTTNV